MIRDFPDFFRIFSNSLKNIKFYIPENQWDIFNSIKFLFSFILLNFLFI